MFTVKMQTKYTIIINYLLPKYDTNLYLLLFVRHFVRYAGGQNESNQKKRRADPSAASWRHLTAESRGSKQLFLHRADYVQQTVIASAWVYVD